MEVLQEEHLQGASAATETSRHNVLKDYTVSDAPKLELDSYISHYRGPTRIERLLLIGTASKVLSRDALSFAARETKQGRNVDKYIEVCRVASSRLSAPLDEAVELDSQLVESRTREVKAETDRLESELKGYKNNLIKESIRMGNEEVGMHYYQIGDYTSAWRFLNRMRDYCTTPKHIAEMSLKLALVAIAQENWTNVQSSVYKIQGLQMKPEERAKFEPILAPCLGLCALAAGKYDAASQHFLSTDAGFLNLEAIGGVDFGCEVLTSNDLAVYGALCALATLEREQLQRQVLDNTAFRNYLELEPHLRRAVTYFVSAKYTQALAVLDAYRTDYALDIYLHHHLDELYNMIRKKSIIAYFQPFNRLSVESISQTLGTVSGAGLEVELLEMIAKCDLRARYDTVSRVIGNVETDVRRKAAIAALQTARETETNLRLKLFRVNLTEAKLELRPEGDKKRKNWPPGRR